MKKMIPIQILLLSSALLLTSCHSNRQLVGMGSVKDLTDSIWTYGISHPDGFTLDINTMTEPVFVLSEGREVRLDASGGRMCRKSEHTAHRRHCHCEIELVARQGGTPRFLAGTSRQCDEHPLSCWCPF